MVNLTHGVFPAIVTPFDENDNVDYDAFAKNIHRLEEDGVDGIVPCGSTGERPTIKLEEHKRIIEFTSEEASKPVIVGTGSPSTESSIELTQHAEKVGADGALIIGPYYSSPSDQGLIKHHREIADATDLPLLLYNHPDGMGFNLSPDVIAELATHPNIVGVKESSGKLNQVNELCNRTSDIDFDVMIGWDSLLLPAMSVGSTGIIGTCSNVIPKDIKTLWELAKKDNYSEALDLHQKVCTFEQDLLIEHPSITVKYIMSLLGYVDPHVRKPQYPLDNKKKDELKKTLKEYRQDGTTNL
ncbi:4-hydroxy-tetrahydrodipicolinate synthase [Haloarcula sp. JP-L23]|uniref:4-hydroxy-tetrahydrodipicolinate synthase n=1 Tax=Haloarcula sp. JP-L23 TaxID=2716717 RepID=UPI00140F2617|nr:4-hydroxy-tetrahydrodipicolinate synthase [Haloarcula sp. JP-L23]